MEKTSGMTRINPGFTLIASVLSLVFCLFSISPPVLAQSPGSVVVLDDSVGTQYIGKYVEYIEDADKVLSINDVASATGLWLKSDSDALSFGFTSSVYWFRFTIENPYQSERDLYLEIPYPLLNLIELYVPQQGGLFNKVKAGSLYPFNTREIADKDFVFLLKQPPGTTTYYVRIETSTSLNFEPIIRTHGDYIAKINKVYPVFWLYYGAMLIMVIYNLVLYFVIRERSYLYLVLFILFYILFQFTLNGFAFQYLWPDSVWWANHCLPTFMCLAMALSTIFMRSFIGMRESYAGTIVDRATLYGVVAPNLAWALCSLLLSYAISIKVATALIIASLFIIGIGGLISLGFTRQVRFIVVSSTFLFLGVLLYALKTFGLLPSNFVTNWGIQIGSAVFISLLSIGLADKILVLKNELITTNAKITTMLRSISQEIDTTEVNIEAYKEEEIAEILNERFNAFLQKFKELVADVNNNMEKLKESSANLLALSDKMTHETAEISANSNSVASASEEMSSKMVAIAGTMEQTSQNINLIVSAVEEMTTTTEEISANTEAARNITENAVEHAKEVTRKVDNLGEAAEKIVSVTEVIAEISKKTNLLALNATIEAARAGEAGKGFAVVANEIKELAKQTANATQQISAQIDENKEVTAKTVAEIGQIVDTINNVNEIVSAIASSIEEQSVSTREIASNVVQISQGVSGVSQNISQCSTVANNVSKEVVSLSASSKEMSENSLVVRQSAEELLDMARRIAELVGRFRI